MLKTVLPHTTLGFCKGLPRVVVPLVANPFEMPLADVSRGVWDVLLHAKLQFDAITVMHLDGSESDDRCACGPNSRVCFIDFMVVVHVEIRTPNELQRKRNVLEI